MLLYDSVMTVIRYCHETLTAQWSRDMSWMTPSVVSKHRLGGREKRKEMNDRRTGEREKRKEGRKESERNKMFSKF